jgi:hypothetical protein
MTKNSTQKLTARRAASLWPVLFLSSAGGRAAVLHVPGDFSTMAAAVNAAAIGDTISIGAGIFPTNVVFRKSLTLAGVGNSQTTLDGGQAGTVLTTTPGVTLTVTDLRIRRGRAPAAFGFGGGVLNDGDLRMDRCIIEECEAPVSGGGLSNVNGTARLVGCILLNNDAGFAGGAVDNSATLTLENCTLTGNGGTTGGAIINTGQLEVTNCTFYKNTGESGGALLLHSGTAAVQYSTFSQNNASAQNGGAVLALNGFTARGALIAGNTAKGTGPDVLGELDSHGYNLIGNKTGATIVPLSGGGPDLIGDAASVINPQLPAAPSDNGGPVPTLMPAASSPALDKGGPAGFPEWDARGAHRPRDGGSGHALADVGAVERGPIGYAVGDLRRALQLAAGLATADANDAWLNVDGSNAVVDLNDCAALARRATGLE